MEVQTVLANTLPTSRNDCRDLISINQPGSLAYDGFESFSPTALRITYVLAGGGLEADICHSCGEEA